MRLLLVTQDFPPDVGGIQTYTAEVALRLARRVEQFAVLAPSRPGGEAVDHTLPYTVYRVPARPDLLAFSALAYLPQLVRRQRFDVAFHAQWQTVVASAAARRLTGYPRTIVTAVHGRELLFNPFSAGPAFRTYDRARRHALHLVDRFTAVSRYTKQLLENLGIPSERIDVVTSGTDPEFFRPMDASELRARLGAADRRVLLTVSRLVPRKGIDTVIRALPRIAERYPDVLYLVIGQGPYGEELASIAHRQNVQHLVRFLGKVPYDELPRHYNACDAFVMPSRNESPDVEGYGVVFLEAGACAKPVIGAESGGIPDAVIHGKTGLLVPPGDPIALADAAIRIFENRQLAAELGRQGRRHTEQYGRWEYVADRTFEVIRRAAEGATV